MELDSLYQQHIARMQQRIGALLKEQPFAGIVIHSGQPQRFFMDDQRYPFTANPHFKQWLSLDRPHCWLLVDGINRPKLILYQPAEFAELYPPVVADALQSHFDIVPLSRPENVGQLLPANHKEWVYLGEHIEVAELLGFEHKNSEPLVSYLHYHRANKTEYEQQLLRNASKIALLGQQSIHQGVMRHMSEFSLYLEYLRSTGLQQEELPFAPSIALNQRCAYYRQHDYQRSVQLPLYSCVCDGAVRYLGYISECCRSYSPQPEYQAIQKELELSYNELLDRFKCSLRFTELQRDGERLLIDLLQRLQLVTSLPDELVSSVAQHFFPYGVGHFVGIQAHDVGGLLQDERGTLLGAPEQYPFLRCTRLIEPDQSFFVDFAIYFNPLLLSQLKKQPFVNHINWTMLNPFLSYGAIRCADVILTRADGIEVLTRT